MVESTRKPRRLSARDRKIIEHVARYKLTTKGMLHRLFFDQNEPNAAIKVANRLCDQGWLKKFSLLYPRQYLVAGKRTVQALGLPSTRSLPLGPQSLPTEFAVLHYAAPKESSKRLTPDEVTTFFQWYSEDWVTGVHTIRFTDSRRVLELIRVDLGGPADHVARKCSGDVETRNESPAFQSALKEGMFKLVVITATSDKASAIQLSLQRQLWPDGISFHLAVIPELLPLLPRCNDAT